jgi:hypothetical protein
MANEMSPEELSRYIHASSWRKVQETLMAIERSDDPGRELEKIAPLICHPRIDGGRLPHLLVGITSNLVAIRSAEARVAISRH